MWKKLRNLIGRSRQEAELDEELAFHLDEEAEERAAAGLPSEEARFAARRDLGNLARVKEETRESWGLHFLETAWQDLRIAARSLRRNPGFSVAAILILGLGIGASTAVFSVVNAVILKPLAFRDPDRIVALRSLWKESGAHGQVSILDFRDWQSQSHAFDALAYYSGGEDAVSVASGGQFAQIASVSGDFFRTLGVAPAEGRLFTAAETARGSEGAVIISDGFWHANFGGDPAALGKTVRIADHAFPIVGIMPPGFAYPDRSEVWIPSDTAFGLGYLNRGAHNYLVVGRLAKGVDLQTAQAEMTVIGNRLEQQYPDTNEGKNISVSPLGVEMVSGVTTMLYLLLGAVLLLLLISCGNVANLLLAKAATRTREMGMRTALGATRGRVIRQLATESLALGVASGAVGVAMATFATPALVALAPGNVPRLDEVAVDPAVLAFAVGLTLFACLLFGLVPALHATRVDVNHALKQGGSRGLEGVGSALRRGLLVAEVAFSVMLLTGAGLLARSFVKVNNVALGFEKHQVVVMKTSNPLGDEEDPAHVLRIYGALLEEAARIPGVAQVGATRVLPGVVGSDGGYEVDDAAVAGKLSLQSPEAISSVVAPGTFATLQIPLLHGRDFSADDHEGAPLTAIINETLAKRSFPGENPVGHRIMTGFDRLDPMTIVGVVGDIRQRGPLRAGKAEIYMPYQQHGYASTGLSLLARVSLPPDRVVPALRERAKALAPDMPVRFTTLEDTLSDTVAAPRFRTLLLAIFAAIAVLLTMGGVYGVVSFLVNQRTQEIGVRMALGAGAGAVVKMVLSQGVRVAALGVALGLVGAAAGTRYVESLLFGVERFDALTYAVVAVLVACITVGACLLPARRAARIDPMVALRQE